MGIGMTAVSESPDNHAIRDIARYAKQQGKQTNWIIGLTIAIFITAVIQIILLIRG